MNGTKAFFDRLNSDSVFASQVDEELNAAREAGASSYLETVIPVAEAHGYKITEEELANMIEGQSEVISEEELGKVAGGTSCIHYALSASILTLVVYSTAN